MKKIKICFILPYAYSLFNPATNYIFGGSEVRGYLFGTGLSRLSDYDVSFIVFDHGQPRIEQFGEIRVYPHSYYKSSEKPISFLDKLRELFELYVGHLNPLRLRIGDYGVSRGKIKIYKQINADIYCTFGASNFSAELALFCKKYKKKFVWFAGSGEDISEKYYEDSKEVNSYGSIGSLCYFAIMQSNFVIAQNEEHACFFLQRYGKETATIANPVALSDYPESYSMDELRDGYALWVGKSDTVKQPEVLLRLARAFSETDFVMVLNRSNPSVHAQIINSKTPNIRILEYVPFNEIEMYFRKAFVLINTSVFEGFPNTFLQAGKYGVPILSLNVDPDKFIETNQCGIVAHGEIDKLKQGLRTILNDKNIQEKVSRNIRQYVYQNHDLSRKVLELHQTLQQIL